MNGRRCLGRRGFTLVEMFIVVAVIAITATAGYKVMTSAQESAKENKLGSDTAHVNEVLQIYLANGGTLPSTYTSATMTALLKTRADTNSAATTVGLTGSYLDARTVAVDQTDAEAATTQVRAVWTGSGYTVQRGPGPIGIKQFNLVEGLAAATPATGSRDPGVLGVNTNKQWIWDYNDRDPVAVASGTTPSTSSRAPYASGTAPVAATLNAPTVPSDTIPLISFGEAGTSVTISNSANPSGVSQVYYSTSTGVSNMLYTGPFLVDPNTVITAYAKSIDPDYYSTSAVASGTMRATPVTLAIGLNATSPLTYAQAGGPMTLSSATAPYATVSLTNSSAIPVRYVSSGKFQTYYSYGSASLTAANTTFAGAYVSPQITLNYTQWAAGATSLRINAQLRTLDSTMFVSSATASVTVNTATTALAAPTISPVTGQMSTAPTVTISMPSGDLPQNALIYYTLDGSTPTRSSSLYSGTFTPATGAGGSISVTAAVFGPTAYSQWFSQSLNAQATYTIAATTPDGALVGSAQIFGSAFVGSIIYAKPASGQTMSDISFTQGARIKGNLYLPGTPNIYNGYIGDPVKWTLARDGNFSSRILGGEFTADGAQVTNDPNWSVSPRVVDLGKTTTPNNYNVVFYNDSYIDGKVYRQNDPPSLPVVAQPPNKDSSNALDYGTYRLPPSGGLSASTIATATINSGTVPLKLLSGNFGALQANNGSTIQLGDASNPNVTMFYTAESLQLNSGSKLAIVGKVVITLKTRLDVSNGSVLGNSSHPDWLTLQFYTANTNSPVMFTVNSASAAYAAIVAPNGEVDLNNGSTFNGSIAAKVLQITSASVAFSIPPVIAQ